MRLIHGDCVEELRRMRGNSVDSVVTDPPYGLNNGRNRFHDIFFAKIFDVFFPEFYKRVSEHVDNVDFFIPAQRISFLNFMNRSIWEEPGVAVPKSSVDFYDDFVDWNEEIKNTSKPSVFISDRKLSDELNIHRVKNGNNFFLKLRPCINSSLGDSGRCGVSELGFGKLGVLVVIPFDSCFSGFLRSLSPSGSTFLGDVVRLLDDPDRFSESYSVVVTSRGAELRAMLSFDFTRGTCELLPATRARHVDAVFEIVCPEQVGAFLGARSLSSMFQSSCVCFVGDSTHGTFSINIHSFMMPFINKKASGFMGKKWDHNVPSVEVWKECLRVLKPGGHLLAFGGTRTYHRMVVNIEDAGFQIRDQINWVYGSGFPKSLDIGKAIDKDSGKQVELKKFATWVRKHREAKGYRRGQLDALLGTKTGVSWWEGRKGVVRIPKPDVYVRLKEVLGLDDSFDYLFDWIGAKREIVGERDTYLGGKSESTFVHGKRVVAVTAPATDDAKKWDGWGTALRPAHEPICMARKPLGEKTVAKNVLKYGCGALNIDHTRVTTNGDGPGRQRWPANFILQHDPRCEFLGVKRVRGTGPGTGGGMKKGKYSGTRGKGEYTGDKFDWFADKDGNETVEDWECVEGCPCREFPDGHKDSGAASRYFKQVSFSPEDQEDAKSFFYCAKASRRDRNEGLEDPGPQLEHGATLRDVENAKMVANNHPTVKPTGLMRYLCRLVTPPSRIDFVCQSCNNVISGVSERYLHARDRQGKSVRSVRESVPEQKKLEQILFEQVSCQEQFNTAQNVCNLREKDEEGEGQVLFNGVPGRVNEASKDIVSKGVRTVRGDFSTEEGRCEKVLRKDVFSEVERFSSKERVIKDNKRIFDEVLSRTSDGSEVGVCDASQVNHGGKYREKFVIRRSGSSFERRQDGQQDREFNSDDRESTQSSAKREKEYDYRMSSLSQDDKTQQCCPKCGAHMRVVRRSSVVLDPFMGSGSTGKGAVLEGFEFMGIERELEFVKIARARIGHAQRVRGKSPVVRSKGSRSRLKALLRAKVSENQIGLFDKIDGRKLRE